MAQRLRNLSKFSQPLYIVRSTLFDVRSMCLLIMYVHVNITKIHVFIVHPG